MLLLTEFTVENFRGIRQGTVSGLTDVNVLIGRNNSGKTTLLEAMHRTVARCASSDFMKAVGVYWATVRQETWNESGSRTPAPKGGGVFAGEIETRHGKFKSLGTLHPNVMLKSIREGDIDIFPMIAQEQFPGVMQAFATSASVFRPPDGTNTTIEAKLWPQLLTDRSDKRLAAALNDVFGLQAESFQLLPSGKLIVLFENHSVPLDAQGDGTRAAMRCLMLLTALKQTMFILEEPECHQHPGSLEKFALAVCKLAKQNEVQLMISTHSGECVKAFLKAAETAASDSAVFHLSLTDGIQTARRLDAEAVETLQNTGIDVRFLDLYS